MEIVVLAKQIPDTEAIIQIAGDGVSIKTDNIKWVVNPYDEIAVEEAIRIKDSQGGTVTVVSMGPKKAAEALLRTSLLAMGADRAILIDDSLSEGSDSLGTAKVLAAAIKEIPFDVIIAGQRAVDYDNCQVGSAVAELLGIPQISQVIKEEISDGKITCHRDIDGGTEVVEASLPALFTTQRGLNEPRYTSLPGIMKAKKKPLDIKTLADIGVEPQIVGSANTKVKITALRLPPERKTVKMIGGESASEKAAALVKALHDEAKVI